MTHIVNCFKISYFDIQWVFVCLRVYGVLRVQQGYELVRYELSHSTLQNGHTTLSTQILAAQRNCQPIRIVFVFSSQNNSGCICKSKWRSTTSISANKWLGKYSSSSMFSTPMCYQNPIYDPIRFASGIFDRYKYCQKWCQILIKKNKLGQIMIGYTDLKYGIYFRQRIYLHTNFEN